MSQLLPGGRSGLTLSFPLSVGTFDKYEQAQEAVDFLADEKFPVEKLAIVGTDLRQYERVVGRKTWGSDLSSGVMQGVFFGLLMGLMLSLFNSGALWATLLYGLGLGVLFGLALGAFTHLMTRGPRDFNSITQTFANSYEVIAEHGVAQQARDMLAHRGLGGTQPPVTEQAPPPPVPPAA